jgi:hypothetical protein
LAFSTTPPSVAARALSLEALQGSKHSANQEKTFLLEFIVSGLFISLAGD